MILDEIGLTPALPDFTSATTFIQEQEQSDFSWLGQDADPFPMLLYDGVVDPFSPADNYTLGGSSMVSCSDAVVVEYIIRVHS